MNQIHGVIYRSTNGVNNALFGEPDQVSLFKAPSICPNWAGASPEQSAPDSGFQHYSHATSRNYGVWLYGRATHATTESRLLSASDMVELLERHSMRVLSEIGGSYQLVAYSHPAMEIVIQNDRQGSIPLFYSQADNWICFASDAKSIFRLSGLVPEVDICGAVSFLREGYPLTGDSLFQGIKRLKPGTQVLVNLSPFSISMKSYWRLGFKPDLSLTLNDATERLYSLILKSHELVTSDAPSNFGVLLTGGVDSRGIASSLSKCGRLPRVGVTWCKTPDIPFSDPVIAGQIAAHFKFPHKVVQFDESNFVCYYKQWLFLSELQTDNMGFFVAPSDALSRPFADNVRYFLVGDEFFGHGSSAANHLDAARYIVKSWGRPASEWLQGCFLPDESNSLDDCFAQSLLDAAPELNELQPRDVIDMLTFYVHRPCWSFSAGNCKEPCIVVRRPYLNDTVIEFVSTLKPSFRQDKLVYYEMLRQHMPDVFQFPRTSRDSLFDWNHVFRQDPMKSILSDALASDAFRASPLGKLLDLEKVTRLADHFFSTASSCAKPKTGLFGYRSVNIRRRLSRLPGIGPLIRHSSSLINSSRLPTQLGSLALIRRLSLLALFTKMVADGTFLKHQPPS